jgi:raffinose/stachyose/melibiose transport system permease protein
MSALSSRPRDRSRIRAKWLTITLFLAPALAIYLLFVLYPVVQAAHYSLFKWNGLTPLDDFIGLKNYADAVQNPLFQQAISNNVFIIVLSLLVQIPFSLMLAVLLNRRFPGRAIFRVVFFLPYVISEAVTGIIFLLMLQGRGSDPFMTVLFKSVGLGAFAQDWLGDTGFVMVTLFFIISWKYFGFHMIILLAGLQGIPREIEEAALIDGAGRWQAFRHVTLPLLGPTLRVSVFLSMIGALQLFDIVWVTTRGGPLDASDTMAVLMIQAGYYDTKMGYGSALAVILFLLGLTVALLYHRFVLSRDIEGGSTAFNG